MKKSLYIIIASLLIISAFSACTPSDVDKTKDSVNTSVTSANYDTSNVRPGTDSSADTEQGSKTLFTGDLTINKEGEGAEVCGAFESIVAILNNGTWSNGTSDGNFKYTLGINDKTLKYDTKNGVIYNENDAQLMNVSEDDKKYLDETLGMIFERIYEDW